MKRYEKFVLEAENGITFEVSEGTSGELIIRALNIATVNVCSTNYVNPPIPEGYKHVCGEWNNGFVIERCSDGSQFVWIPVGSLDSNGTLDGEHFSEKFGRRNYMNNEFNEALNGELLEQFESVKDSTEWGNHWNTENSPKKVVETGSREEWCANNIYDFAGNVDEWTQEQNKSSRRVTRGGDYNFFGNDYPVAYRNYCNPYDGYDNTGFRATLYIK